MIVVTVVVDVHAEDANGHQYRHNGTTENCACPPREVVCNFQVSVCMADTCMLTFIIL